MCVPLHLRNSKGVTHVWLSRLSFKVNMVQRKALKSEDKNNKKNKLSVH